jgi:hypothetical protein
MRGVECAVRKELTDWCGVGLFFTHVLSPALFQLLNPTPSSLSNSDHKWNEVVVQYEANNAACMLEPRVMPRRDSTVIGPHGGGELR